MKVILNVSDEGYSERTYEGYSECTWWRLFQKHVVCPKFDIYVFNFWLMRLDLIFKSCTIIKMI